MPLADFIKEIETRAAAIEIDEDRAMKVLATANLVPSTREEVLAVCAHLVAICVFEEAERAKSQAVGPG